MSLTLNDYQRTVAECAINRAVCCSYDYLTCGLIGETGELAEEVRRVIRDDGGIVTDSRRCRIIEEAGDVLWYVAALGNLHEWELSLPGAASFEALGSMILHDAQNWTLARTIHWLAMHVGRCSHSDVPRIPRYGYLDHVEDIVTSLARVAICVGSTPEHVAMVNMAKIRAIQERGSRSWKSCQDSSLLAYGQHILHDEMPR